MTATTQQHMRALALANDTRGARAELKRHIRSLPPAAAAKLAADTLTHDSDDQFVGGMSTLRLLLCIRQFGETRAAKCLLAAGVRNFERPMRELTCRQRDVIAGQLQFWAATRRES